MQSRSLRYTWNRSYQKRSRSPETDRSPLPQISARQKVRSAAQPAPKKLPLSRHLVCLFVSFYPPFFSYVFVPLFGSSFSFASKAVKPRCSLFSRPHATAFAGRLRKIPIFSMSTHFDIRYEIQFTPLLFFCNILIIDARRICRYYQNPLFPFGNMTDSIIPQRFPSKSKQCHPRYAPRPPI